MEVDNISIHYYNLHQNLVKGYSYLAIFFNGAEFDFWCGSKLNRKQARQAALLIANGDYKDVYNETDIVSVRQQKIS